jgi:hypothetical protein
MKDPVEFQDVYHELRREFDRECKVPLNSTGEEMLEEFFRITIQRLLIDGAIPWNEGSVEKKFSLRCAAELGKAIDQKARDAASDVTDLIVVEAANELMDNWERKCPLPPASPADPMVKTMARESVVALLGGCTRLRPLIAQHSTPEE